jgi:hypothetical protein
MPLFGKNDPMKYGILSLGRLHRKGHEISGLSSSPERFTVDFLINGKSLYTLLNVAKRDFVGRFALDFPNYNQGAAEEFITGHSPHIDGMVIFFECPLCADIGCGAILGKITKTESGYKWSDFAYYKGWYEEEPELELYKDVGPFEFSATAYERTIKQAGQGDLV